MLVQIFASSACTGVVCTIGAPSALEQPRRALAGRLADAADDARQRPDLLQEAVGGDPLRHVRDEDVLADREAAVLLEVAGDELGRAGRDGRAQHEQLARRAGAAAGRRAPRGSRPCRSRCARSVGVPSVSTIASACAASVARAESSSCTRASSSSVPGSLNGIRPRAHRLEPLGVLVDAEHAQAGVGEARARAAGPRGRGRSPRRRSAMAPSRLARAPELGLERIFRA